MPFSSPCRRELLETTCRLANTLKRFGVHRGDRVAVYMPVSPLAVAAMLACARIGAVHTVVFAGFSAESLAGRIKDALGKALALLHGTQGLESGQPLTFFVECFTQDWTESVTLLGLGCPVRRRAMRMKAERRLMRNCKVVVTSNQGLRGGRVVELKKIVDQAVKHCPTVQRVLVAHRTDSKVHMGDLDVPLEQEMAKEDPVCAPESMGSEDMLFMLYTSGSTGLPKGVVHTQAGYLLYAALTHKLVFDHQPGDIFGCVADIGWITGHSYVVYGPLCNGATSVLFESTPVYPNAGRYWETVERLKINQFYGAPTAIRLLLKYGDAWVKKYDRSSLRTLGSALWEAKGRSHALLACSQYATLAGGAESCDVWHLGFPASVSMLRVGVLHTLARASAVPACLLLQFHSPDPSQATGISSHDIQSIESGPCCSCAFVPVSSVKFLYWMQLC
ncbi:Acetyl-coenzyme A synthetase 2-like, mitochondrial [Saguinus oedipus]|uniref:acetate--CoA ligase n=1 Tax=Saguinus oedipus TaxID=9490 RepID=A0ABQ9VJ82_SAGOE|nr:Acetyl-coenzyme A synthetase 2-like, mitochondrial [Saguinus oedipus]